MNTNSINGLSANYLQSMLANQLTSNSLNSSSKNSKNGEVSAFSKMLSDASANSPGAANMAAAPTGNPTQMLSQMIANFQTSGMQSQGQSFDPMSIGA